MQQAKNKISITDIINKVKDFFVTKWQSILFGFVILVSITMFIYTLAFATGWATADDSWMIHRNTDGLIRVLAHDFNSGLLTITFLCVMSIILALMFGTISRKKYYYTNYIVVSIIIVVLLVFAGFVFIRLPQVYSGFRTALNDYRNWDRGWVDVGATSVATTHGETWLAFFIGNHSVDVSLLPAGFASPLAGTREVYQVWFDAFRAQGQLPADTPAELLRHINSIYSMFYFGYFLASMAILSAASLGLIMYTKYKKAKEQTVTYSQVAAAIAAGEVEVVYEEKKTIDLDDETIKINVTQDFSVLAEKEAQLKELMIDKTEKEAIKSLKKEISELKVDKMRFQTNKQGYLITMLAVAILLIAGFMTINFSIYDDVGLRMPLFQFIPNIHTAFDIVFIIVSLLTLFLTAEKLKFYKKGYVYTIFVVALFTIIRIFYVPLMGLQQYNEHIYADPVNEINRLGLSTARFIWVLILMVIAAALQVVAGVITFIKIRKLEKHFEKHGEK